jgi:hypothetical protein
LPGRWPPNHLGKMALNQLEKRHFQGLVGRGVERGVGYRLSYRDRYDISSVFLRSAAGCCGVASNALLASGRVSGQGSGANVSDQFLLVLLMFCRSGIDTKWAYDDA